MRFFAAPVAVAIIAAVPLHAQQPLAREILKQLIGINTTESAGDTTAAAEAMAERFRAAGFPENDVQVLGPAPRKGNLVVRLRGTGQGRPVLFIGHLDVVEAKRSDWSMDPFEFVEKDGYFYGRGAADMKGDDAILVAIFLRLKSENFQPARDLILALTADEEGGIYNGVDWLLKNHRELIDAEYCLNSDGGGGVIRNGRHLFMSVQAAEKVFMSFRLDVSNPGGHSSLPRRDNAIYHLSEGLARLARFDFPIHLFDVTRTGFERAAPLYTGQLGEDLKIITERTTDLAAVGRLSAMPLFNALIRTTCVPTMMSAGHAENALPQTATAVVNCRLLPVDKPADVQKTLVSVLGDPAIKVTVLTPARVSKYVPLNPKLMAIIKAVTWKYWPGMPVIPVMSTGASDGVYLNAAGIPTYGVNGIFGDEDDVRAHGRDERVMVSSFFDAVSFMYGLATAAGKSQALPVP